MSNTQHTPGPLEVRRYHGVTIHKDHCGCDLIGEGVLTDPIRLAPCTMHAAAPDLLAVAEAVEEHFRDTDAPLGALARAAIAKARGEGER